MLIELGLVLNLVTMFEKKKWLTFVAVIAQKRSVTDRQTDKPKLITPLLFFEKWGITSFRLDMTHKQTWPRYQDKHSYKVLSS